MLARADRKSFKGKNGQGERNVRKQIDILSVHFELKLSDGLQASDKR